MSQCLVRFISLCWITGGYTVHQPIEGLLRASGVKPTPFQNSAPITAGLQVRRTTSSLLIGNLRSYKKNFSSNL